MSVAVCFKHTNYLNILQKTNKKQVSHRSEVFDLYVEYVLPFIRMFLYEFFILSSDIAHGALWNSKSKTVLMFSFQSGVHGEGGAWLKLYKLLNP